LGTLDERHHFTISSQSKEQHKSKEETTTSTTSKTTTSTKNRKNRKKVKENKKSETPKIVADKNLNTKNETASKVTYCDYVMDLHRFPFLARQTADRLMSRIPEMQFDLGLVVEAREDDTLPERMLVCAHFKKIDFQKAYRWGEKNQL
jgi:hypothetical protein